MGHLISVLFHFLRRNLVLFTSIVLVLASAGWLRNEWKDIRRLVDELPSLQKAQQRVGEHQTALGRRSTREINQLSRTSVQALNARISKLDSELRSLQKQHDEGSLLPAVFKGPTAATEQLTQAVMRNVSIEILSQERVYLHALRAHAIAATQQKAAIEQLGQQRLAHVRAYAAVQSALQQRTRFKTEAGPWVHVPLSEASRRMRELNQQVGILTARNNAAHQRYLAQRALLSPMPSASTLAQFQLDERRLAAATAPLRDRILEAEKLAAQSFGWRAYQAVQPLLLPALGVLAAWWLVPAAIRTFFYFVMAPLAMRRPPIVIAGMDRLQPASSSPSQHAGRAQPLVSAVSRKVVLAPDQEMLIKPNYCQSQPAGVDVGTSLLFNRHHLLTSVAAQLWMLKRLRTTRSVDIVVSPTTDALEELALLELAPGEAFVFQPRALVGLMHKTGAPPKIRSHWRLTTLHAWLTLQLRYLTFEGPATLIVKGCRGVQLESAMAGRTISQGATLGFSANTAYATLRAEPFLAYLTGTQALFHDKFTGQNAYFLYEEVPRNARPGRSRNNPLNLLLDASLKAFGI